MLTKDDMLTVLLLEDNYDDLELIRNELQLAGYRINIHHAEDRSTFIRGLEENPDLILSDYSLPNFDAMSALEIARETHELTPFIIVSGVLTDEAASMAIRQGAWDYLLKDRLGRLGSSIEHALREREMRRDREQVQTRLEAVNRRLESALSQLQLTHGDLEQAHEALKENQTQLVQAEKLGSLGQLTAGIAHEINNPIGFVRSNLDRMAEYASVFTNLMDAYDRVEASLGAHAGVTTHGDEEDVFGDVRQLRGERDVAFMRDDIHLLLEESISGLEQITEIVQGLRDFSRIDEPDRKPTDLNAGIEATLRLIWNEVKYRFDVKKELNPLPPVLGHPSQLNQVFMNIVLNAVQATPDRGILTISTSVEGDSAVVRISDTGPGIPEDVLPHIFEPFYTTKPVGKGTGLGLSISYGIIKRHQGTIEVDTEPDKGTTFVITLPLERDDES